MGETKVYNLKMEVGENGQTKLGGVVVIGINATENQQRSREGARTSGYRNGQTKLPALPSATALSLRAVAAMRDRRSRSARFAPIGWFEQEGLGDGGVMGFRNLHAICERRKGTVA